MYGWRLQQEHALIAARGSGSGMSDSQVRAFVDTCMSPPLLSMRWVVIGGKKISQHTICTWMVYAKAGCSFAMMTPKGRRADTCVSLLMSSERLLAFRSCDPWPSSGFFLGSREAEGTVVPSGGGWVLSVREETCRYSGSNLNDTASQRTSACQRKCPATSPQSFCLRVPDWKKVEMGVSVAEELTRD